MSRNRVRPWDKQSFNIQAGAACTNTSASTRNAAFRKNKKIFVPGKEHLYRRLSIRECARVQSFPDDFIFEYENLSDGYKMIGKSWCLLILLRYSQHKLNMTLTYKVISIRMLGIEIYLILKTLSFGIISN